MRTKYLILQSSARNHGAHFENHKAAFMEGAADPDAVLEDGDNTDDSEFPKSGAIQEKGQVEYREA